MTTERELQARINRMVFAREKCISDVRKATGHLPRPAISAIYELCDTLMELCETADRDLEITTSGRAPV